MLKVGCVSPMVVVSILPSAEIGPTASRKDEPHFIISLWFRCSLDYVEKDYVWFDIFYKTVLQIFLGENIHRSRAVNVDGIWRF